MKYDLVNSLISEFSEYQLLFQLGSSKTSTGAGSWTSTTSGTTYIYNGQNDLFNQLQTVLNVYLISASDFNNKADQTITTRHQSLFDDVIQGTTQTPTYTSGQITQILHKDSGNNILRTDLFKYLSLANLITNGSFENGATGWSIATGAPSVVSTVSKFGTYAMYQNNTASAGAYYSQSFNTVNGHKFYYSAWCKNATNVTVNCDIGSYGAAIPSFSGGSSSFVYGSTIFTCTDSAVHTANVGWSTATNNGAGVWADGVTLIDLTAIWGVGNEPTQAQMDAIMALYGFIDTTPAQRIEETRTLSTGEKLSCAYNFDALGNFVAEVVS